MHTPDAGRCEWDSTVNVTKDKAMSLVTLVEETKVFYLFQSGGESSSFRVNVTSPVGTGKQKQVSVSLPPHTGSSHVYH